MDGDNMIIRVFDQNRADICDDLLTRLIRDERQYDDSIDENFVVKDYFRNVIKNKDNILLCYEEDGIIEGYIYLKIVGNDNKKGYLVDGLYVVDEYRKNGIANRLMDEAMRIVRDTDAKYIDINVLFDNKVAYELYKSFGFNEFKISFRKDL